MKKLTQKLVLSVITMALVVVALGTSTFAWFTLQNSATVGTFQAQVTSGDGIEVSLGDWVTNQQTIDYTVSNVDNTWFTTLPSSAITALIIEKYGVDANSALQSNMRFSDVTSPDGVNINDIAGTPAASAKYVEFDLFFRSASVPTIAWNRATVGGTSADWTVNVASFRATEAADLYGTDATNKTLKVAAWTAARVSVQGTSTIVYESAAVTSGTASTTVFNSNASYTDSYDLETLGVVGTFPLLAGSGDQTPFGAAAYEIANTNTRNFTAAVTVAPTVTSLSSTSDVLDLTDTTATNNYFTGSVTVRVWVEGWDADAFDAIFATVLTVSLGFTASTTTP